MLYDPKWEKTVKADPFTIEALIAWLEQQPAARHYEYMNCDGECLYGQYMRHVGVSWKEARYATYNGRRKDDIHAPFREAVYFPIASSEPHTFGNALYRARGVAARPMPSPQGTK